MSPVQLPVQPSLKNLRYFPAHTLREDCDAIPATPGVYLWFVRGGKRILDLTHYRETDSRRPRTYDGHAHLYTGAARDLRYRLTQHLRNEDPGQSSPRKSLWAIERVFGAVTGATTSSYNFERDGHLTEWIYDHVVFGIQESADPFYLEAQVIESEPSPFNIAQRRRHRYSKFLMAWRAFAFPSDWMSDVPFGKFEFGRSGSSKDDQRKYFSAAVMVK